MTEDVYNNFLQNLVSVEFGNVLQKELIIARGNDFSHCLVILLLFGVGF